MGRWHSAAMRAAVQGPHVQVYSTLELSLVDSAGTATWYRFAEAGGLPGATFVSAEPRVVNWGPAVKVSFDPTAPTIGGSSATITLADDDGSVRARLEAGNNRRRPALVRWVVPASTDICEPIMTGIIASWTPTFGEVSIQIRNDDQALEQEVPRLPLLRSDRPDLTGASAANYGTYFPLVYGTHSAYGLSGAGMVRCIPVAWTSGSVGWYSPMLGVAVSVPRVYVSGALQTVTTHYTIETSTTGGKTVTLVKFTAGNIPLVDDEVTCDIAGADQYGTGAGPLLVNPVRQIRAFALDHVWCDWRTGAYPSASPTSTCLDDELFADAIDVADRLKLEGSLYVGGGKDARRARDVFEDWSQSWPRFRLFWTRSGKLGIRSLNLAHPGYRSELVAAFAAGTYRHEPTVIRGYHKLDPMDPNEPDTSRIIDRAAASYCYSRASGSDEAQRSFEVYDPSTGEDARASFDMPFSAARAV